MSGKRDSYAGTRRSAFSAVKYRGCPRSMGSNGYSVRMLSDGELSQFRAHVDQIIEEVATHGHVLRPVAIGLPPGADRLVHAAGVPLQERSAASGLWYSRTCSRCGKEIRSRQPIAAGVVYCSVICAD